MDEVKRSDKFEKVNQETDPECLWQIIEETHKVNTVSKVQSVMKKATRAMYQRMRQGAFESIITYKERFNAALKGYEEQKNPKMEEKDIAMDFFEGLDNARYATFKTEIMNSLTSKAIEQPKNLNEMYLLANQWLKTTTKINMGYATTFVTTLDHQERNDKRPGKQQEKSGEENKKREKDVSKIECYACGKMGHYANKCPSREKKDANENEEEEQEEERNAHLTWNANAFTTYQVTAVQQKTFGPKDVLLDSQANISVV